MKKTILFILSILIYNIIIADTIPVPELNSPITDLTGTLNNSELELLKNKLLIFEEDSIGQIVILLIQTTGEETIEEFSIRLTENWKIGSSQNDDGLILLVAKEDRTLRIEVGYGLEEIITDAEAAYIIDNIIVPEFKNGDFFNGINSGIDRIMGLMYGEIITSAESTTNEIVYIEENTYNPYDNKWYIVLIIIIVMAKFIPMVLTRVPLYVLLIYLIVLLSLDLLTGIIEKDMEVAWMWMTSTCFFGIIPLIINIIRTITGNKGWSSYSYSSSSNRSSSSSSWSSYSSSSGSSSYSSGSSSGYSGGGGSFGGGGASGSW